MGFIRHVFQDEIHLNIKIIMDDDIDDFLEHTFEIIMLLSATRYVVLLSNQMRSVSFVPSRGSFCLQDRDGFVTGYNKQVDVRFLEDLL